jgi:hypothetical protein
LVWAGSSTYGKISREKFRDQEAVPQCSTIGDNEDEQAAKKREIHGERLPVGAPGVKIFCTLGKAAESCQGGGAVDFITVFVETSLISTRHMGLQSCGD